MGLRLVGLAGAIVSFDLNFREKLWRARGDKAHAQETIRRIVEHVDVLVGNEEDLQRGLGMSGPEVARTSGTDPAALLDMIVRVVQRYPRIRVVATTLREVHSDNRHSWGAVAWVDGSTYVAPTRELDVFDRVGGGDGFAAGFFYGLLTGASRTIRSAWAGPPKGRGRGAGISPGAVWTHSRRA